VLQRIQWLFSARLFVEHDPDRQPEGTMAGTREVL
jgi:hypothetical protein